jgi:hypothetical protein
MRRTSVTTWPPVGFPFWRNSKVMEPLEKTARGLLTGMNSTPSSPAMRRERWARLFLKTVSEMFEFYRRSVVRSNGEPGNRVRCCRRNQNEISRTKKRAAEVNTMVAAEDMSR